MRNIVIKKDCNILNYRDSTKGLKYLKYIVSIRRIKYKNKKGGKY
jgi:hypothetical protein